MPKFQSIALGLAASGYLAWNLLKPARATSELRNALAGGGDFSLRQRVYHLLVRLAHSAPAGLTLKEMWMAVAAVLFVILVLLAVAPGLPRIASRRWICSPVLFGAAAVLFILFLRLPYLAQGMLNTDEAQFIAAALKLERDPVFFRSIHTANAGPLIAYALLLPKAVGAQLDYATARLVGLVLFSGGLMLCYRALARSVREETARVAMLPVIVLTALLTEPNYVHYSSEQVPVLLFCLGFYLFVRFLREDAPHRTRPAVAFGILFTLGFFAKLQVLPLLAGLAVLALAASACTSRTPWRSLLASGEYMALGGAASFFTAILAIRLTGGWEAFRTEYLFSGVSYMQVSPFSVDLFRFLRSNAEIRRFPVLAVLLGTEAVSRRLWSRRDAPDQLRPAKMALAAAGALTLFSLGANIMGYRGEAVKLIWAVLGVAAVAVAGRMVFQMARGALALKDEDWIVAATVVSLVASAYAIITPNRPFLHYFNLMIVPAGLLWAVLYIYAARDGERLPASRRRWAAVLLPGIFLLFSIGLADTTRTNGVWGVHPVLDDLASIPPTLGGAAARAIASVTRPGELLGVWGMETELYYETALVPATNSAREAYLGLVPVVEAEFASYVEQLHRTMPPVFVDAVGPGRFWLEDRSRTGHEAIPALRAFVDDRYRLLCDTEGYRVYVLREASSSR
jgi:hypothetical protein